ncbi:flavin monoamine oxidase family protein [Alteribacter natronophilus]|uniref:flavin monoamine oxidase family protein n=1 Tax=Alteribacter natronophilus TaxID=2583810 RepID=UPI00110D5047|nr:flavin monoamine oxidase family protein [Alteribacter natronophilus]TMW72775.1 amine oxidase [Alteribacter natronophilus]
MDRAEGVQTVPEEYIEYVQKGLPAAEEPKRVLILGAGIAGLTAGKLLKDAGHEVTILEGNDRVGGRIHTIREPFTEGNYFEAGPMRIPEYHELTLELIRQFGLPVNEFIHSANNDLYFINNRLVRRFQYEEDPDVLGFPLPEDELGKTAGELLESALSPFYRLYRYSDEEQREELVQGFDQYSMESFLRNNPVGRSLSANAVRKIQVMLGIQGFPELSFIDIFRNIISTLFGEESKFYEVTGGNDRLPAAFLNELGENILYNQRVTDVYNGPDQVIVQTIDPAGQASTHTADYVITTIPFSAFQFIRVHPFESLPFEKRTAIQTLHYLSSVKVGLEFSEKFWERDGMRGGSLTTDLPIQFTYYPSNRIGEPGPGVIQASYTWGDNARLWESLTDEERVRYALDFLASIHGDKVRDLFLGGASYSWAQNPFAAGCFTLYAPNQAAEYPAIIKQPEGRMHFAGEHTSNLHGWVEGAVESGVRAAVEVNEA